MKVYIASCFADKARVATRSTELMGLGIFPTNRWHTENAPHNCTSNDFPDEYFRERAVFDVEDIEAADVFILTVPSEKEMSDMTIRALSRGGRHFETGLFYGYMLNDFRKKGHTHRRLIVLGKRENVFHFLDGLSVTANYPAIKQIDTWEETKEYLLKKVEKAK
jgi:hypothetical protein